jgi:hypothetical protein
VVGSSGLFNSESVSMLESDQVAQKSELIPGT